MKINKMKYLYVGVDLHKNKHVAVLCNCVFDKIATFKIGNTPAKFPEFINKLKKYTKGQDVIFGLEDVNFYGRSFAKFLIQKDFIVKEVNSSYTKKKRKAGTNRNKTDELDALAIAKNLITEFDKLPYANPKDIFWTIKQTLSSRNNYMQMMANIKVSLHNLLVHNYPNYKSFFKNLDGKTVQGFFKKFPNPEPLMKMNSAELLKILKEFNKSTPAKKADEILQVVKEHGCWENGYQEERSNLIKSYISTLNDLEEEIEKLEKQMDILIDETGYPLKSIPGVDTVLAATFIANIGDINRFSKSSKLAKIAGIAPIEHSSGETSKQYANKLGNRELNNAFYSLSLTQIRKDINPIMYEYYQKKIKEGRKKKQAMVYVERRLVNIVYRIMKDKVPYMQPEPKVEEESA
ncbi:IS110 family transposase [Cerasibacillus terrae]|uniref:IS110 family transposase n=1 Tax=Cerasibacillus terrae TaxID=2498845 RepID=A0A5C8P251_9BACI|nr:IS110 family transposase [Cerasibacillus terrae]TXL67462.1 IS110 family transposase [Cerasibacillus terrae]